MQNINIFIISKTPAVLALLFLFSFSINADPTLPAYDKQKHTGVASCANSVCHGAVIPHINSNILHNEYTTWGRKDPHSQTYKKLFSKEYIAITKKLGLKAPHKEEKCLVCHASNISTKYQGRKFSMNDGIGCETCHGGAEKYLSTHTNKKATRKKNIENGLYPTDNIIHRTRLCLSCHYGTKDQFVTHEIMGAGHPRISFELDTFSELLNPHYELDKDYRKRKVAYTHVKTWAIGQAVAAESILKIINSKHLQSSGLFPELSLFDCHSCHHPMSKKTWRKRQSTGLGPGAVPFNDSSLIMLRLILKQVEPELNKDLSQYLKTMHNASNSNISHTQSSAKKLQSITKASIEKIKSHTFSANDVIALTRSLISRGIAGEYQDYISAEQCVMAIGALTASWNDIKPFDSKTSKLTSRLMNDLYTSVANDENFRPYNFKRSLIKLKTGLLKQ
jgi:Cytochrome c554 and c-prime